VATIALASLVVFSPFVYASRRHRISGARTFDYYKGASEYLLHNSKPKTVVFNTDWDDFPYLFFFNSENYYVLGLDQLYMERYDPQLFALWRGVCEGRVSNPSRVIRQRFGAEYVVVDVAGNERGGFIAQAEEDKGMQPVFEDRYCTVYRIASPP
jgi:hypothetical protein